MASFQGLFVVVLSLSFALLFAEAHIGSSRASLERLSPHGSLGCLCSFNCTKAYNFNRKSSKQIFQQHWCTDFCELCNGNRLVRLHPCRSCSVLQLVKPMTYMYASYHRALLVMWSVGIGFMKPNEAWCLNPPSFCMKQKTTQAQS